MSNSKNSDPTNTNSTNSDPTNSNSSVNLSSYGSSNNSDYNANAVVNSNIYQLSFLGKEDDDEYYYEVDNIPVTNSPLFRKGQVVSSDVELEDIDTNYTIEGKLFTLVEIKEDDADSDVKYYLLTPVTAGGKQKILKKSRKGAKKSRKGAKKSRKGTKKSRKGAKK